MGVDKYNKQRKRILERIDKGQNISIMELGMYNLTPYFDMEKFDVSLSEAIMLNKNFERRIQHIDKEIFFSPAQYDALKMLEEKERVILSAPTSFGKTLLIKEYIYLNQPKHIVYIVPTNALAYELEKSFKGNSNFDNYIIFDKCTTIGKIDDESLASEKLFFIGTQEKYLEISNEMLGEIDLFVIDEAYKLHESVTQQRAYKLSETFLDSITNKSKKVFLLTPKAIFNGFEKYNFYKFDSDFNAVEKNYIVLEREGFFDLLIKKGEEEKTILFCSSPNQINEAYDDMIELKDQAEGILDDFIKQLELDIHPDWSVVKLLKCGILTHHGQMPKYVQNRMINLFNSNEQFNILLGTNSISEGINTVTKNLFIHPDYNNYNNTLLLKNTIGRAGRLGEYPIGYVYSTVEIEDLVEKEIEISLAISSEEELSEIEDSKNDEKILELSERYNINSDCCKNLLNTYKVSLTKLEKILNALKKDYNFPGISNLPFLAASAFGKDYTGLPVNDKTIIRGYLQNFWQKDGQRISLNDFNDRIKYFKEKSDIKLGNTEIINCYMLFIYSTLEYCIMPLVNIGLEIKEENVDWGFGRHVVSSLEECKKKYYTRTYGNVNYDELSESHKNIIGALKDYGMTSAIKNISVEILEEINECLNIRYSTIDVLNAIEKLTQQSKHNKAFFRDLKKNYM